MTNRERIYHRIKKWKLFVTKLPKCKYIESPVIIRKNGVIYRRDWEVIIN